jgi:predicted TIM-barrel fold metal-dependent hydrolase
MPLQDDMQLVSVDDHVVEPPNVWQDRLPKAMKELGPRIVDGTAVGDQPPPNVWLYEGRQYPSIGLNAVAGKPRSEWGLDPTRYDQMRPGCYDAVARIEDMDLDGVHAGLNFPTFPRFAGTVFLQSDDKALALACVRDYNDWTLDEWCASAPDRLIPCVLMPMWDPDLCAAEVQRTAAKGARTISFPENPVPLGLPSFHTDHWDPFWRATEECEMPVSMHFGTSGSVSIPSPDGPMAVWISLMGTNSQAAFSDLIFSEVFHKFPGVKVSLAEGGIGWMPWLLERIDYTWERHSGYQNYNTSVRPSELVQGRIFGCFIEDIAGLAMRHEIGIDRIMWEGDYPHSDSQFPGSRKRAAQVFENIPDDDVRKIVETNARTLFRFPRS